MRVSWRVILAADGLHGALGRKPAEHLDGKLGADAAHRDQPLEEPLLFALEKAEERDLVFADLGVDMQRRLSADDRQCGKRGHGDGDVVSNAAGLDDGLAGLLEDELAAKMSDHVRAIVVSPSAWPPAPVFRVPGRVGLWCARW